MNGGVGALWEECGGCGKAINYFASQALISQGIHLSCGHFQETIYDPGATLTLLLYREPCKTLIRKRLAPTLAFTNS